MTFFKKALSAVFGAAIICSCAGCAVSSAAGSPSVQTDLEVTGTPLTTEQLADFSLDTQWAEDYVDNYDAGAFLDTLDEPQIKTAYCKALALVRLLSTENLEPSGAVDMKNRAYILVSSKDNEIPQRYMESGYTYDSFMSAYSEVFTEAILDTMLSRGDVFYPYNGELWYAGVSAGGNGGEVHREYELISRTDTEVRFRRIMFSVGIGEPVTEYSAEKRGEYIQTSVDFRFVLTDDGWKADEFLNQQSSEDILYFL